MRAACTPPAAPPSRAGGLWQASDPVDALIDPDDLLATLDATGGLAWWHAAAPSYRRNILRWIAQARRPETRASRVAIASLHAARGEKVPQY